MVDIQRLTELSKRLRHLKQLSAADIRRRAIAPINQRAIIFPKFSFGEEHIYVRTAPWMFNGFVIRFDSLCLVVDPGVDFLTRCVYSNINLIEFDALFISHAHYDHCASAGTVIDTMAYIGDEENITLLAPKTVFAEGKISGYHANINQRGLANVKPVITNDNQVITLGQYTLETIPLFHSTETYGFVLNLDSVKVGYLSDTGYTVKFKTSKGNVYLTGTDDYEGDFVEIVERHEQIKRAFQTVDILICNLNDFIYTKHSKYHLTGFDLIDILKNSQIKTCVINHLNQLDLTNNKLLKGLENYLQEVTGVRIRACFPQGLKIDLS